MAAVVSTSSGGCDALRRRPGVRGRAARLDPAGARPLTFFDFYVPRSLRGATLILGSGALEPAVWWVTRARLTRAPASLDGVGAVLRLALDPAQDRSTLLTLCIARRYNAWRGIRDASWCLAGRPSQVADRQGAVGDGRWTGRAGGAGAGG